MIDVCGGKSLSKIRCGRLAFYILSAVNYNYYVCSGIISNILHLIY